MNVKTCFHRFSVVTFLFISFLASAQSDSDVVGQEKVAAKWSDGQYEVWLPDPHSLARKEKHKFIPFEDKFMLNIDYDESSVVEKIRINDANYYQLTVKHDASQYVMGFERQVMYVAYFKEDMIIVYAMDRVELNSEIYMCEKIQFVIGNDLKKKMKDLREQDLIDEVNAYRKQAYLHVANTIRAAISEEERLIAKNTLKDKEIEKIEFIFPEGKPERLATSVNQGAKIGYQITLKDGDVLRTENIGGETPLSDLKIRYHNCEFYFLSSAVIGKSAKIGEPDVATVYAKSKYGNSEEIEVSFPLEYNGDVFIQYDGENGIEGYSAGEDGRRGYDGGTINCWISKMKHTETGEDIYVIKEDNRSSVKACGKINLDADLVLRAEGGNGGDGSWGSDSQSEISQYATDGGDGGDGGNGGLIKIYIDPSAQDCTIYTYVSGGSGGSAGKGGFSYSFGSDGERGTNGTGGIDGTVIKKVEAVNF